MYNILYYHQYEVYLKNIFNIHRSQSTLYCSYVNKSKINENINLNWWNITQWVFNSQIINQKMYNILYYHQYEVYLKNIFNIHRSQSTFYCSYVNKSKINENINLNWWNITQWVFHSQIINQIFIIYCIIMNMKYI